MLRQVLAWAVAIAAGLALGAGSGWAALEFGQRSFSERIGDWSFNRAAGSSAAGPYTRAIIAKAGLLALSAREAVYFTLDRDAQGRPLDEGCVYDLSAQPLPTRWWSVTLYASDNYLARNTDYAASVDASRVLAGPDGAWRVRVSPVRGEAANWVSSRNAGRGFTLTLRLYNADDDFRPSAEILPTLHTVSCAGDAP